MSVYLLIHRHLQKRCYFEKDEAMDDVIHGSTHGFDLLPNWWIPLSFTSRQQNNMANTRPKYWFKGNSEIIIEEMPPHKDWYSIKSIFYTIFCFTSFTCRGVRGVSCCFMICQRAIDVGVTLRINKSKKKRGFFSFYCTIIDEDINFLKYRKCEAVDKK